jgi:hypothetical protein
MAAMVAWSLAFTAEAHTLIGEERKTRLNPGSRRLPPVEGGTDDPMFGVFAGEQLGGFVGACYLRLHDPRGAQLALQSPRRGSVRARGVVAGSAHISCTRRSLTTW